jgi:hypothetical protein
MQELGFRILVFSDIFLEPLQICFEFANNHQYVLPSLTYFSPFLGKKFGGSPKSGGEGVKFHNV